MRSRRCMRIEHGSPPLRSAMRRRTATGSRGRSPPEPQRGQSPQEPRRECLRPPHAPPAARAHARSTVVGWRALAGTGGQASSTTVLLAALATACAALAALKIKSAVTVSINVRWPQNPTANIGANIAVGRNESQLAVEVAPANIAQSANIAVGRNESRLAVEVDKSLTHNTYVFNERSRDPAYLAQAWPSVVVLGVQKGGTTSLSSAIMRHSGICRSNKGKETHFLTGGGRRTAAGYPMLYGGSKTCSRRATSADIPTAKSLHPILGGRVHLQGRHFEGTPRYFDYPGIARKFFSVIPKALHQQMKFIVVLREPISRDLSAYNHMRGSGNYHWACRKTLPHLKSPNTYASYAATFRGCWSPRGREGSCSKCMKIVAERGRYHQHLENWFQLFGREKFLVLESSMVWDKSPPEVVRDTLERVGRFLGLATSGLI